jgi:hypothetical protein
LVTRATYLRLFITHSISFRWFLNVPHAGSLEQNLRHHALVLVL